MFIYLLSFIICSGAVGALFGRREAGEHIGRFIGQVVGTAVGGVIGERIGGAVAKAILDECSKPAAATSAPAPAEAPALSVFGKVLAVTAVAGLSALGLLLVGHPIERPVEQVIRLEQILEKVPVLKGNVVQKPT